MTILTKNDLKMTIFSSKMTKNGVFSWFFGPHFDVFDVGTAIGVKTCIENRGKKQCFLVFFDCFLGQNGQNHLK